ncbi:uncharacterized protein LOC142590045 [Dermacentor variabilis]|uniref:uncharacterized protein LOC142590045 n=1 Tax=Dermacentor variabilis TaxID=34621 RepID=UPI003F5B0797
MRRQVVSCVSHSREIVPRLPFSLPVPTLPELSSVLHHSPGQLREMSTVAAPKRHRWRKFQSKLPFLGPGGIDSSTSPSDTQANLPELFALLTTQPEANEDERRCDVAGNATEPPVSRGFSSGELATTPATTTTVKCEARPSSDSAKPSDRKECEASASDVVENEASFFGQDEVIVNEEPEPKRLANYANIVKMVREISEGGPAEEVDQLEDLPATSLAGSRRRRTRLPTTADASTRWPVTADLSAHVPVRPAGALASSTWTERRRSKKSPE